MLWKRLLNTLLVTLLCAPALPALAQRARGGGAKASTAKAGAPVLPPIKYTQFFLPNGMRVIFHEDHSTPIVGVNVWYHVGSKNEDKGRTGFAHLFEHMMFQGFTGYDYDYLPTIQEMGGAVNGSTTQDRTNYWELIPSNFLESALFVEAGRMKGLLEAMTQTKLDNQRDVVKNEKRQRIDNQPYGQATYKITEAMYPEGHPYRWSVIGSMEDLSAAAMDDVKGFFRRYYVPNNASLVIAGDFDPKEARAWVEKYFGADPEGRGGHAPAGGGAPKLDREVREQIDDRVQFPRLYMVWHSVPQYSKDEAALDLLANILSGGKSGRFYKALQYGDNQIAQQVAVFNNTSEIAGLMQLVAHAAPRPHARRDREDRPGRDREDQGDAPDGRGDGARLQRARSLLHLRHADRRRLRRQGRPAQLLRHLPRRPRLLRERPRALPRRDGRRRAARRAPVPDRQALRADGRPASGRPDERLRPGADEPARGDADALAAVGRRRPAGRGRAHGAERAVRHRFGDAAGRGAVAARGRPAHDQARGAGHAARGRRPAPGRLAGRAGRTARHDRPAAAAWARVARPARRRRPNRTPTSRCCRSRRPTRS